MDSHQYQPSQENIEKSVKSTSQQITNKLNEIKKDAISAMNILEKIKGSSNAIPTNCVCNDPKIEKNGTEKNNEHTMEKIGTVEECPCEPCFNQNEVKFKEEIPNKLDFNKEKQSLCYLPCPEDKLVEPPKEGNMGPIGPWATGRLDWSPLAGITGIRPIVDKYSITRYSEGEWRKHNADMLANLQKLHDTMDLMEYNGKESIQKFSTEADHKQDNVTEMLRIKTSQIFQWKHDLEKEITTMADEIKSVEEQRTRLQQATEVLLLPQSIAGECLERRTSRLDKELVRDEVEEELIKELALTAEIREIFQRTLKDVELQLEEDKIAKQRLEYDWSDKTIAYNIESFNISLNNTSRIMLFKPGSVIFPNEQSSQEYWEHFTNETIGEARKTRLKSINFRSTLDAILINAARDLRTQAQKIDLALSKRTKCTQAFTNQLETQLKQILRRLADIEILKDNIEVAIRKLDFPLKKAQTRLDNRLLRPRVENCRDEAYYGMVNEVKAINQNVANLKQQLDEIEKLQSELIQTRNKLERELMVKRQTLEIDVERTTLIRSFYPPASALSGY